VDEIRQAGGEVFAITSEPNALAIEAEEDWKFGFTAVGDPHQEIRETCRARGWIDVYNNKDYGHLRHRPWARHPKGYYQPAVIALHRDGRILYRWRCIPNRNNMSGAGARPEARYTWNNIQSRLFKTGNSPHDDEPLLGAKDLSWFRFLVILLAHGWFIRPRAFPLARPGDPERVSPNKMMPRIYLFTLTWLAALALLPLHWVVIGFVSWIAILTPGLMEIHRQFQNETSPDKPCS